MIRRKRADTFVYRLYCDRCGAEMKATPISLPADPPIYPHECGNQACGNVEQIHGRRYPLIDTIEINEESSESNEPATPDGAA